MGATYTRQSTYTDGDIIQESDTNDEFDQLLAAFAASTGHTHDGTTGEGGPVTKLLGTGITIGDGTADTDITVTFDGETTDGVLKWIGHDSSGSNPDYFEFSDDVMLVDNEAIIFGTNSDVLVSYDEATTDTLKISAKEGAALGITLMADEGDDAGDEWKLNIADGGTLTLGNDIASAGSYVTHLTIAPNSTVSSSTTTVAGNLSVGGNLDVTGTFDLSDSNFTNAGDIQLDSISGDADSNTSIAFSGSDVITVTTGGETQITFNNGSILPTSDNDVDLGSSSYEFKDLYIDGTAYVDAINFNGTAISATAAELNLIDGDTARGTTAVASGDGILINDASTMRMTNVDTVSTYFSSHSVGGSNIVTTGALNSGSITSGFGTIDTGSSTITTTGLISGGSLDIDSVLINGTTIGHTDDTDLITLADGVVTVAGELDAVSLDVSGNVDIDGITNLDAVDIDGAVQLDSTLTIGANDQGYDVILYGDTASANMTWDTSVDDLIFNGAARVVIPDGQLVLGSTAVSSTAAELNILDGKAFLNESDLASDSATGIPSQQSVKAYVDNNISSVSASSTTTFTNKTLTAPKIVDGGFIADANGNELVVFQTTGSAVNQLEVTNNASGSDPILAATGDDTNIGITLTPKGTGVITIAAGNLDYGGTAITSTGAELNLVDGSSAGTIVNSKGVIYSSGGVVNATSLAIAGTALTATAAEYNLLDGDSTVGTTAVADGDGLLTNDGSTMRQTTVQTFATYFADKITAMSNLVTTGALNSGSITSGFGTIDTGASAITTTGVITGGTLEATTDTAAGDNAAIGYTAAEGLILTGQGSTNDVTIKNDVDADVIEIPTGTTNVTVAGALKPATYQETYSGLSAASTISCDLSTANHFAVTIGANTTFTFDNPPTSGTSFAFTLIITQHSTAATLSWPGGVDWAGGSQPDIAGNNEVQAYGFITRDNGTTYYGFLGGTAIG